MFGSLLLGGEVPWIVLVSGDWQGDTGSFTLGTGTITANANDKNVRTNDTLIGASQDFDFEGLAGAWSTNQGLFLGACTNGTTTGAEKPTTTDPSVYADNAAGSTVGWAHGNDSAESTLSAGWMAGKTIRLSRRGSTFYGLIDGVLSVTYASTTSSDAVKFFVGSPGAGSSYGFTGLRYRGGPGLPTIS